MTPSVERLRELHYTLKCWDISRGERIYPREVADESGWSVSAVRERLGKGMRGGCFLKINNQIKKGPLCNLKYRDGRCRF